MIKYGRFDMNFVILKYIYEMNSLHNKIIAIIRTFNNVIWGHLQTTLTSKHGREGYIQISAIQYS